MTKRGEWEFMVSINGGLAQEVTVKTSIYREVAAAVPALLGVDLSGLPVFVEIWTRETPDKALCFTFDENEFGQLVIGNAVRKRAALKIADERSKENVALRAALQEIAALEDVRADEASTIARRALEQSPTGGTK